MECFNYPIDTKYLLRKKRAIKQELLSKENNWICKRIAVLGGATTNELVEQLELFLLQYGIKVDFYQSEYGRYWQDAVFSNDELVLFKPDMVYICTSWRNINFPDVDSTREEVDRVLHSEFMRYREMWEKIECRYGCTIVQNNFDRPDYRLLGNRDVWDYRGRTNFIFRLNNMLYEYAQDKDNFYINDIDYLASQYGLDKWHSSVCWYMYKYAINLEAVPLVAWSVAKIIKSIYGKNKKLLALDLDNTLWGGVIGDDGIEGIVIGQEISQGQAYHDFQMYCKNLKKIGILLAINSKNEEKNALLGLNHIDGVLRPDDFVSIKANWNTKDSNLHEIASDLSLGTDSIVFVDDNPAERAIVSGQMPEVSVPEMVDVEQYISVLDHSGYFEVTSLSIEDFNKTALYHAKEKAQKRRALFDSYDDYLDSLEMVATVDSFRDIYIKRIAQLTNKSNQFNLTTLRCSEADISRVEKSDAYICLCGRLKDRFADNGIVSIVICEIDEIDLHIRLWLMSCRVLKRGMENIMMDTLIGEAVKHHIRHVYGYYYPTAKNAMVKDFYTDMGFKVVKCDEKGNAKFMLDICNYKAKANHIKANILL